ncbi:hypothetical protein D9757_015498 [Collybiopsis confluens]|uniref:Putative ER transporter 6TM N-terminal domain-containing protein n=1 Tax=Collybiopsis confluens TaxID=2823264 RepID=A0A8H5CAV8_9AGAR|nr:hypothetical protein D9757_015457 [Collybiopsis confluens]KAF5337884.1 hypothetical protein D9757_015498 [Collybiopsis confluens]
MLFDRVWTGHGARGLNSVENGNNDSPTGSASSGSGGWKPSRNTSTNSPSTDSAISYNDYRSTNSSSPVSGTISRSQSATVAPPSSAVHVSISVPPPPPLLPTSITISDQPISPLAGSPHPPVSAATSVSSGFDMGPRNSRPLPPGANSGPGTGSQERARCPFIPEAVTCCSWFWHFTWICRSYPTTASHPGPGPGPGPSQYQVLLVSTTPMRYYAGGDTTERFGCVIAIIFTLVVFPETMSHSALRTVCEQLERVEKAIAIQGEVMTAVQDIPMPGEKTRIEKLAPSQPLCENGGSQVSATLGMLSSEFSVGKWSSDDVQDVMEPLGSIVARSLGLQSFSKLVWRMQEPQRKAEDGPDSKAGTFNTTSTVISTSPKNAAAPSNDAYLLQEIVMFKASHPSPNKNLSLSDPCSLLSCSEPTSSRYQNRF